MREALNLRRNHSDAAPASIPRSKLRRFVQVGLLTVTAAVATDFVLAQVGKILVPTWRGERVESGARILHPIFHHGLEPLAEFQHRWGNTRASYFTNSLGFRDASAREVALVSDKRRVLFMGDSMTEGLGVPYEETFVGRIGEALAGRGIEVLNGALTSYSGSVYYRKTKYYVEEAGLKVDSVVVFIDISDMEDEVRCYRMGDDEIVRSICPRPSVSRQVKAFLKDNSVYYRLYRTIKDGVSETLRWRELGPIGAVTNLDRGRWTLDEGLSRRIGEPGLVKNRLYLDKLHAFLSARGVPLTVAVYPWPDQILARDLDSRQVAFWRAWAEKLGVGFVNLFPAFIDGRDPEKVILEDFIPYDVHFNAAGHARVAKAFLEQFRPAP